MLGKHLTKATVRRPTGPRWSKNSGEFYAVAVTNVYTTHHPIFAVKNTGHAGIRQAVSDFNSYDCLGV